MPDAHSRFRANMRDAAALAGLYDVLSMQLGAAMSLDDLLRSQIVYAISAFDKLIHDLVRRGMVEIFTGQRAPTAKYLSEPISLSTARELATTTNPPPEVVFEQTVRAKLKTFAFQEPEKVCDGLSYIWNEDHKWQRISVAIGQDERVARTTLKLIVARRNGIVHEADMDPVTHLKIPIIRSECDDVIAYLEKLGDAIYALVC